MNPPLRSLTDKKAVVQGLKKGVIDCIVTDHAPHHQREKDVEFDKAPFGTIGLETALAVALSELYHSKTMSLESIIDSLTYKPKKIIGVQDFAEVREGLEANICLVDINEKWMFTQEHIHSRSHNSCFLGKELIGRVKATFCQGQLYEY